MARFVLRSSKNAHANSVALAPVYIADPKDDMETVKDNGRLFASLDEMGLITLDYDLPLKGYDYGEYHQSALYAYFQETVKEASQNPGFSMDVPHMDLGSMALTQEGHELLQALMAE